MKQISKLFLALALLALTTPAWANRLLTAGCETNDGSTDIVTEFDTRSSSTGQSYDSTVKHSGTDSCKFTATSAATRFLRRTLATAMGNGEHLYVSLYYEPTDYYDTQAALFYERTTSTAVGGIVQLNTSGNVVLKNSVTSTTQTSSMALSLSIMYRLEYHNTILNSGGSMTLGIFAGDSTTALETLTISAEDTLNVDIKYLVFGNADVSSANFTQYYDDIVVNDGAGSAPFNAAPGPHKICLLTPNADTSVAWTKAGGTPAGTNYGGVNGIPGTPVDATNFNTDAQATNVDRLGLSAMPAEVTSDATIISADVYARVSAASTATSMLLRIWDQAGTPTDGPSISLPSSTWKILSTVEHLAYNASGKTKANFDSFDVGYIGGAADGYTKQIGDLWVNVEWLEASAPPANPGITAHICTQPQ
jgi:hypothetical protein